MARAAGKKQAPAKVEEDDDNEGWDDAVVDADSKDAGADLRLRDWRDVERFREMKELRNLVDDDYGLEEIFRPPVKLRDPARAARLVPAPAKAVPAKAPAAPAKPAAKAAKEVPKPHPKPAARPAPKAKAKAKRK
jgi:hypothetical protein